MRGAGWLVPAATVFGVAAAISGCSAQTSQVQPAQADAAKAPATQDRLGTQAFKATGAVQQWPQNGRIPATVKSVYVEVEGSTGATSVPYHQPLFGPAPVNAQGGKGERLGAVVQVAGVTEPLTIYVGTDGQLSSKDPVKKQPGWPDAGAGGSGNDHNANLENRHYGATTGGNGGGSSSIHLPNSGAVITAGGGGGGGGGIYSNRSPYQVMVTSHGIPRLGGAGGNAGGGSGTSPTPGGPGIGHGGHAGPVSTAGKPQNPAGGHGGRNRVGYINAGAGGGGGGGGCLPGGGGSGGQNDDPEPGSGGGGAGGTSCWVAKAVGSVAHLSSSGTAGVSISAVSVGTTSLAGGVTGQSYLQQLQAFDGSGSYTWSIAPGSPGLPEGLQLDAATGIISGIAEETASKVITVAVTDSRGAQTYSLPMQLEVDVDPAQQTSMISPLSFFAREEASR